MKKLITFCFIVLLCKSWAQCTNTVSPSTQSVICANGGSIVSFTATAISPSVNIRHDWYSPLNPLPGGVPVLSSTNAISVLAGRFSPGEYTLVTTDLGTICQVSKTFTITSPDNYPTYTAMGTNNFSVGCSPNTIIWSTNGISTQFPPSILSFTFLPPSYVGTVFPNVPLGNNTSTLTSIAGTWTMILQDNSNFCRSILPIPISQSTMIPSFTYTVAGGGTVNFQSTSTGTTVGTTYSWDYGDGTTGLGMISTHTYSNGGIHNVVLNTNNPSCNTNTIPINVNTIPCTANSGFSLTYSGIPQNWLATPNYYGNVINAIWNWGDGSSDNNLFTSHTYSAAGLYNICLSVTVSCAGSSSTCSGYNIYKSVEVNADMAMVTVSIVPAAPVGIRTIENDNNLFSIYPNPSNSNVHIQNPTKKVGKIKVLNIEGEEIQSLILEINNETKIENLNSGIYFIIIEIENSSYRKKIIVLK